MKIGSLFSGIGGLELGLERAGLGHVVWQVENNAFCNRVLAKHWPNADRSVTDVRLANAQNLAPVDLICGGFPCQDLSVAGKQAGLEGARSGLWFEYARIVRELRPRFVVVENVNSGRRKWMPSVRQQLYLLGYDSVALGIPARDVGAPHRRERVFVVAYAYGESLRQWPERLSGRRTRNVRRQGQAESLDHGAACALANADSEGQLREAPAGISGGNGALYGRLAGRGAWAVEPGVGRVAHGLPDRMDRMRALGNAVVPQCAEIVGRLIGRLQ